MLRYYSRSLVEALKRQLKITVFAVLRYRRNYIVCQDVDTFQKMLRNLGNILHTLSIEFPMPTTPRAIIVELLKRPLPGKDLQIYVVGHAPPFAIPARTAGRPDDRNASDFLTDNSQSLASFRLVFFIRVLTTALPTALAICPISNRIDRFLQHYFSSPTESNRFAGSVPPSGIT